MKKYIAVLLSLIIALSCFAAFSVSAASAYTVGADNTAGKAGEDVTVDVKLNVSDANAAQLKLNTLYFTVSYNTEYLTLKSVDKKITLPSGYNNVFVDTGVTIANQKGFYVLGWNPQTSSTPDTYAPDLSINPNQVIATLTFTISSSAAAGDSFNVAISDLVAYAANHSDVAIDVKDSSVSIACTNHDFDNWKQTTAPGCTTKGEEKRSCKVCGYTETREVAATGHTWGSWQVITAASCENDGVQRRVCDNNSDHFEEEAIPATDHNWGAWTVTTVPTEDAEGERTRTCANDASHVETIALAKLNTKFVNEDNTLEVVADEGTYLPSDTTVELIDIFGEFDDSLKALLNDSIKEEYPGKEFCGLYAVMLLSDGDFVDLNGGSYTATISVPSYDNYTNLTAVAFDLEGNEILDLVYTIDNGKIVFSSSSPIAGLAILGQSLETSPQTGDNFMLSLALILVLISFAGVVVTKKRVRG